MKYTIIAGNQSAGWRFAAVAVAAPANWVPDRCADWWGIRHTRHGLQSSSDSLRSHTGKPTLQEWFDQAEQARALGHSRVTIDEIIAGIHEGRDE